MVDGAIEMKNMDERKFWLRVESIILISDLENYENFDAVQNLWYNFWCEDGVDGLISFQANLSRKIYKLFQPKIAEIFRVTGYKENKVVSDFKYISNDGFIDFRAWIVSLGKEGYEQFLNFQSEEELLKFDLDADRAYRDEIPFFAYWFCQRVFQGNGNCDEVFKFGFDGDYEALYAKMDWEWDVLEKKYPLLYQKYQK